jgi:hypothetical protein
MPVREMRLSFPTPQRPLWLSLLVASTLSAAVRPSRAADPGLDVASAGTPGMSECLSANETSITLRRDHKLRQARDRALICAATTCPDAVRDVCRRRATELSEAIPTVVFVATDAAGHDEVAVHVSMDGETISDHLDGTAIPVDPGQRTFTFHVAGQPPVEHLFVISEGQKSRREVITFGAVDPSASQGAPAALVAPASTSPWGSQRIAAIATGAVGIVGIGLGGIFGGLAASEWSSAKSACVGKSASCTTGTGAGAADESSASSKATVSTVGFIAGGVLLAGGVVLFVTAPKASSPPASAALHSLEIVPAAGPGGAWLTLRGAF